MHNRKGHGRRRWRPIPLTLEMVWTALLLVLGLPVSSAVRAQNSAGLAFEEIARQAEEARREKRLDDAIALYRTGLKLEPAWGEGNWYLGTTLYGLRRFDEARDAFQHLALSQPANGPAWALAGMSEFELGNYAKAMEDLTRAKSAGLGQNEDLASLVQFRIALLLNREGKFEEALDQLIPFAVAVANDETIEALGLNRLRTQLVPSEIPEQDRDLFIRGGQATKAYLMHDTEGAARFFQHLVAVYPNRPGVHYARGAFLVENDPAQALQEFQRELEINPTHPKALLQVTTLYLKQNAAETALPYARRAVKANPDVWSAHRILGESLLETGDASAAVPELQTAARLEPEDPEAHYLLARAYKREGNASLASKELAEFQRLERIRENQAGAGSVSK